METAEDPGFDVKGLGRLMAAAFTVNANSDWNRQAVMRRYPSAAMDVRVVYHGSALEGSAPAEIGSAASPEARTPFILCVARLADYKDLDLLVMAFAGLAPLHPEVSLILCGADQSNGGLQRFIDRLGLKGRVGWLGRRTHEQVLALLRDCLFLVLPSRRESLGGCLIEAMEAGKAVVAARMSGIPDLIRNGEEGLLVEPKDIQSVAAAMRSLLRDPELRENLGRRGLARSAEFTWDKAIDSYFELYRSHPGARGSSPKIACVLWDRGTDAAASAVLGSLARSLRRRDRKFCACLRRGRQDEPFRTEQDGWTLYRLGYAPESRLPAETFVILAQLLWIGRAEKVRVWHDFIIRYRDLGALTWLARLTGSRPVVSLY